MEIPLFSINWSQRDIDEMAKVIKSGKDWAIGSIVKEFENALSEYIGTKYALVFNSGTSALHALMIAFEIGRGDEVIVPSFTFVATANAPLFVGAKPVFADIEEETYGLDPESVLRKITDKTKAVIPVHYAGCPCKIRELKEIADDYGLFLIEDAAEAFGAGIGDRKAGTFGDAAMFSFCQNKIITTGDGGAVTTDSEAIYEKLKLIRSHGGGNGFGYNFRMSNLVAALGNSQLKKADYNIRERRKRADYFNKKLPGKIPPKDYFHVYQLYTIEDDNRDGLKNYLEDRGISSKVYFYPIKNKLPITEKVSSRVLTLPLYPTLTRKEMDYIIENYGSFTSNK